MRAYKNYTQINVDNFKTININKENKEFFFQYHDFPKYEVYNLLTRKDLHKIPSKQEITEFQEEILNIFPLSKVLD